MKSKTKQIKLIFTLILTLLAVIFVVLNTNNVAINFGLFQFKLPLIIILVLMIIRTPIIIINTKIMIKLPLIIILVLMIIIGVLIGYFWGSYGHNQDKNN